MLAPAAIAAAPPQEMPFMATVETMKAFAYAGLADTNANLKNIIGPRRDQLLSALGADQATIAAELAKGAHRKNSTTRFLPLPVPKKQRKDAYFLAFFRPRFRKAGEPHECDIDLFLVCKNREKTIGLAFERGRRVNDMHGYAHVQFRREFGNGDPDTDLDVEFALSYPALTTRCRPPGDTWLSVLVALYGLGPDDKTGLGSIVNEVAQAGRLVQGAEMLARARYLFLHS